MPVLAQTDAAPEITSAETFTVFEGNLAITTLTATDSDTPVANLKWSKENGADNAEFVLSESGVLAFDSAKDYEQPDDDDADRIYEVSVQVSDGVNDTTANLQVTLDNVIELEHISGPATVDFAENSWSRVASFTASSQEDRDGIEWTLGGDDATHFSIDEPSGALRFDIDPASPVIFAKPPDFEAPVDSNSDNVYAVTLLPRAGTVSADTPTTVTVTVTDVDEDGAISFSTKRPRKAVEFTATLTDPDGVVDGSAIWVWERTSGRNMWTVIAGANSPSYTPTAADAGSFLRVGATYTDRHGSGKQAKATVPEVVAADQLSDLSISTESSAAATQSHPWRRARPAFDAETLHYSIGCNNTDTMTLMLTPADASSRISVDGTQYTNPGVGASVTATQKVSGNSVVRIALTDTDGASTQYVVHCLDPNFSGITVDKPLGESEVLDELILIHYDQRLLIIDSNGVPRFNRLLRHRGGGFFRFYPDGGKGEYRFSYMGPGPRGIVLDQNLNQIASVNSVAPLTDLDSHDFRVLENGNYMLMAYQDAVRDLSHLTFRKFGTAVAVEDSAIQIVTPSGQATFNWNSWDHMALEDCLQHAFPPHNGDYAHLNATQMVDGHIIASMRGCSRVLAIDVANGAVIWRVGPSNLTDEQWAERDIGPAPLDIVGDPAVQFCGQHGSALLPNGNLILYDNGVACSINPWTGELLFRANGEFSRGVEYAIDTDNGEAVFVRHHTLHGTESETGYRGGHIEPTGNGHWLISWGSARQGVSHHPPTPSDAVTQVDPDTGQEWLSVDIPSKFQGLRATIMPAEALAENSGELEARFPESSQTSKSHLGVDDAPQVVVAFNGPVTDFDADTSSLSVQGATVTSVVPHLVQGEPANAYLLTLAPEGADEITVGVIVDKTCDSGICAADGTRVSGAPPALVIGPPVPAPVAESAPVPVPAKEPFRTDTNPASFGVSASADRVVEGSVVYLTVDTGGVTLEQAQNLTVAVSGSATLFDDFMVTDSHGQQITLPVDLTLASGASSAMLRVVTATDAQPDDGETVVLSVRQEGTVVGEVTIILTDVDEPPQVGEPTASKFSYAENSTAPVGTFTAADAEGDATTWSLVGSDAMSFSVIGGELRFRASPNYETPHDLGTDNVYNVTVLASDAGVTTKHNVVVVVTDVDEAAMLLFADVHPDNTHRPNIEALHTAQITTGCSQQPLQYCPNRPVTRAEMATFLTRALDLQIPQQHPGFADVHPNNTHRPNIEALHTAQITKGCSQQPLQYCPNRPVTRAEMATFLTRALNLQIPQQHPGFADVHPNNTHRPNIEALHTAQITKGCSQQPLQYCPNRPVTRAEMATFLTRARRIIAIAEVPSANQALTS